VREVKPLDRGGNVKTIIMKGVKHYTKEGEYKGKTHKMDGEVHTGTKHSDSSKVVSHKPFKMKGYTYPGKSPLEFKGANSSNSKCWPGKKKVGTKPSRTRPGVTVNDCE